MAGFHGSGDALDGFDHVQAFDHFTEHGITPALYGLCAVVEERVVGDVDEELRGRRMRFHGASHGHGTGFVAQAIVGFVLDRRLGRLLLHARFETATLDHEVADHAVEHSAVVMAALHVFLEVGDGFRRLVFEQVEGDDAVVGVQLDHVVIALSRKSRAAPGSVRTFMSPEGQEQAPRPVRGLTAWAMISALF